MYKHLKFFYYYFDKNNLIDLKIIKIIYNIVGVPDNELINVEEEFSDKGIKIYRLKLTGDDIMTLEKELRGIGVDFNSKFRRDWRHFHITFFKENINDDMSVEVEDEGTAYEKEDDSWDVYYVEGSLQNYLGATREYFIFNVSNNEIGSLGDIKERFKKWVDEQKERMKQNF